MYLINYYLIKYSVTQFIGQGRTFKDFNNKMNKHKRKAAAPRGRLAHTKPQIKSRPVPLSSGTVFTH